jgi:polyhydroxyalkanoate synthase subunit PhaC
MLTTAEHVNVGGAFYQAADAVIAAIDAGGHSLRRRPEPGESKSDLSTEISNAVRSISKVAEHWLSDLAKTAEAQSALLVSFLALLLNTLRRLSGESDEPVVPYGSARAAATA